mmetsp:Transcript_43185/g.133412  ORF Transcript_43185/g.133412 Transcript_43185/m.133412 type:complete len:214 (+) Transcript_43185:563-1204(+)
MPVIPRQCWSPSPSRAAPAPQLSCRMCDHDICPIAAAIWPSDCTERPRALGVFPSGTLCGVVPSSGLVSAPGHVFSFCLDCTVLSLLLVGSNRHRYAEQPTLPPHKIASRAAIFAWQPAGAVVVSFLRAIFDGHASSGFCFRIDLGWEKLFKLPAIECADKRPKRGSCFGPVHTGFGFSPSACWWGAACLFCSCLCATHLFLLADTPSTTTVG